MATLGPGAGIQATIYSSLQSGLTQGLTKGLKSLLPQPKKPPANIIVPQREARITLEYIAPTPLGGATSGAQNGTMLQENIKSATLQRPPSTVAKTTDPAATPPAPQRSTLTMDVSIYSSDAIAESLSESMTARQVTHNTAAGFYVDEWGFAPGSIQIGARVIFRTQPDQQIQSVRSWFQQTKRLTPFIPGAPGIVRFHDSFSGISLQLNLVSLTLTRVADDPVRGQLTITAEVLADLTNLPSTTATQSVAPITPVSPASSLFAFQNSQISGSITA